MTRSKRFELLAHSDEKRRYRLVEALVARITARQLKKFIHLMYSSPFSEFIFPEDVPFLLGLLQQETDASRQTALTYLIADAWGRGHTNEDEWRHNFDCIAAVWQASSNGSGPKLKPLQNHFDWQLRPVKLRSAKAVRMQDFEQKQLEQQRERQKRQKEQEQSQTRATGVSPTARIIKILTRYDAGRLVVGRAWRKIEYLLCFDEKGRGNYDPAEADLAEQPGWLALDDSLRDRVAQLAKTYLTALDAESLSVIHDPQKMPLPSGYRALRLSLAIEPEWIKALQPQTWAQWAPAIVFFYDWQERETPANRVYLSKLALQNAETEFLRASSSLIDTEVAAGDVRCLDWLRFLCQAGDKVAQLLLLKAQIPAIAEVPLRQLLLFLIKKGDHDTQTWARSLVVTPPPISEPERMHARVAAEVLLNETPDAGWPQVLSAFESDPAFGRTVVEHAAPRWFMPDREPKPKLSEQELADFYLWLTREFPSESDEAREGVGRVTPRYQVEQMRSGVLNQLISRKTEAGCRDMERIVHALPDNKNLNWMLQHAREEWRRASWTPMTIRNALQLGRDAMSHPTIAIVTALEKEHAAMHVLLDEVVRWKAPSSGASGTYDLGKIAATNGGEHGVALALLPSMGNNLAGIVTAGLLRDLPSVRHVIMCGIAGGVPSPKDVETHVRLGDIVVSGRGGVVQYDFGKMNPGGTFEHSPPPRAPSARLLHAFQLLRSGERQGERPWLEHIEQVCERLNLQRPDPASDELLASTKSRRVLPHPNAPYSQPRVFDGTIASANAVLKDPKKRDELRDKFHARAVEMEGSGIADATWEWDRGGYFIVRGACDYCDKRNKGALGTHWQGYAAVVAAAFTRALIESLVLEKDA